VSGGNSFNHSANRPKGTGIRLKTLFAILLFKACDRSLQPITSKSLRKDEVLLYKLMLKTPFVLKTL
jgi:hypothetical protein